MRMWWWLWRPLWLWLWGWWLEPRRADEAGVEGVGLTVVVERVLLSVLWLALVMELMRETAAASLSDMITSGRPSRRRPGPCHSSGGARGR